jgi:hypothetical protein
LQYVLKLSISMTTKSRHYSQYDRSVRFEFLKCTCFRDLRCSQWWLWWVITSGTLHYAVCQSTCFLTDFLFGLFFNPEDGGDIFCENLKSWDTVAWKKFTQGS